MSPTLQPSPLSNSAPRRILMYEPSHPAIGSRRQPEGPRDTSAASTSVPHSTDTVSLKARFSFSTIMSPPVVQDLNILSEFFTTRCAPNTTKNKIIAVDGLDGNAVLAVIAELHRSIVKDLQYTVHVLNRDFSHNSVHQSSGLAYYMSEIHKWDSMCSAIFKAPPIGLVQGTPSGSHPAPDPAGHICVWIVPLSPFMATLRAATHFTPSGFYDSHLWRWLAGHWNGRLRPDITVNVQGIADTASTREVLVFEGGNMNTLLMTQARDSDTHISSQLRRVIFEVENWLQGEGST